LSVHREHLTTNGLDTRDLDVQSNLPSLRFCERAEGYQQRRHRFRLPSPNQDYRGPEGVVGVFKELDEHRLQPRAFRTAWASGGTPTRATLRERGAATPQQPAAPGNRASNTLTMTTYPLVVAGVNLPRAV